MFFPAVTELLTRVARHPAVDDALGSLRRARRKSLSPD